MELIMNIKAYIYKKEVDWSLLNQDADNQIIICPNHHTVIHAANPIFDYKRLSFLYQNGYEERVLLNRHLG